MEIDGAVMMVCGNCVKLGRPVGGPVARDPRPTFTQPAHRPVPAVSSSPDYEVDPEYNVKIRQAREKLGLSQEDLGKMLNEKPSLIRMVESKKIKPDVVLTRKLMHYLKVNLLVPLSELEGPSSGI